MAQKNNRDSLGCCLIPGLHEVAMNNAVADMDLLLCGETGVGKDRLANHIHALSHRTGGFVGMNCAAIPEQLAESQLFGVASGAFTGACRARAGYVEAAHGGTLYLDEIDSMPLGLQAKLLRVLEARGVERLGSTKFIALDLRIIASTQRPLERLVDQGLFRRDLFFRLNALTVQLPALRQRRELILPLFEQFSEDVAAELQRPVPALDTGRIQLLLTHDWPGNIRELKSAAKRFVLGLPLLASSVGAAQQGASICLREQLRGIERQLIQDALRRHGHNLDGVVQELHLPKRTLYHRMKALGFADCFCAEVQV
jgi:transcriptional regulator with PAS, ATPase and Fis domain